MLTLERALVLQPTSRGEQAIEDAMLALILNYCIPVSIDVGIVEWFLLYSQYVILSSSS